VQDWWHFFTRMGVLGWAGRGGEAEGGGIREARTSTFVICGHFKVFNVRRVVRIRFLGSCGRRRRG
jgi:hypothetical protein